MSDQRNGGIEWTDQTWNPLRGCSRVSEGCRNCYAETMAARFAGPGQPYEGTIRNGKWNGTVKLVPERLADPLRWQRRRSVFVNSMSDLFHPSVPFETVAAIFGVMAAAPQHTFQVLTKRPERALEWFEWYEGDSGAGASSVGAIYEAKGRGLRLGTVYIPEWPLPNVWLGVSVEDQRTADERIPQLLQCPAAVRWVSAEPLLGPVCIESWIGQECWGDCNCDALYGTEPGCRRRGGDGTITRQLDWLVVGGESGPGARPMHPDWARSLRDQCHEADVPFLFKQWGDWADVGDAHELAERGPSRADNERVVNLAGGHGFHGEKPRRVRRVGKKAAGRLLDGICHDGYPAGGPR